MSMLSSSYEPSREFLRSDSFMRVHRLKALLREVDFSRVSAINGGESTSFVAGKDTLRVFTDDPSKFYYACSLNNAEAAKQCLRVTCSVNGCDDSSTARGECDLEVRSYLERLELVAKEKFIENNRLRISLYESMLSDVDAIASHLEKRFRSIEKKIVPVENWRIASSNSIADVMLNNFVEFFAVYERQKTKTCSCMRWRLRVRYDYDCCVTRAFLFNKIEFTRREIIANPDVLSPSLQLTSLSELIDVLRLSYAEIVGETVRARKIVNTRRKLCLLLGVEQHSVAAIIDSSFTYRIPDCGSFSAMSDDVVPFSGDSVTLTCCIPNTSISKLRNVAEQLARLIKDNALEKKIDQL